jgi:hypothetical protein
LIVLKFACRARAGNLSMLDITYEEAARRWRSSTLAFLWCCRRCCPQCCPGGYGSSSTRFSSLNKSALSRKRLHKPSQRSSRLLSFITGFVLCLRCCIVPAYFASHSSDVGNIMRDCEIL